MFASRHFGARRQRIALCVACRRGNLTKHKPSFREMATLATLVRHDEIANHTLSNQDARR